MSAPGGAESAAALAGGLAQERVSPSGRILPREGANDAAGTASARALERPSAAERPSLTRLLRRYPLRQAAPAASLMDPKKGEPRVEGWLAVAAAIGALAAIVMVRGPLRAALPLALLAVAVVAVLRSRRARARSVAARAHQQRGREVTVRPDGIALSRHGQEDALIDLGTGFGTTLFSSRHRDRAVVAVTSRTSTVFLGATFDAAERRAHAAFLARASVVDGDEALDAVGPDGLSLEMGAVDFVAFSEDLVAIDSGSSERIVLSDGRGQPVVLDGPALRVGEHRFDLLAPIEWRPFLFQEPFGGAVAVFQATWIRQGSSAVVLVALVPSVLGDPAPPESTGIPELDRALLRDLRLASSGAGEPPAPEQRVAVDRLFVLPFRAALDRAPRASSQPPRDRTV